MALPSVFSAICSWPVFHYFSGFQPNARELSQTKPSCSLHLQTEGDWGIIIVVKRWGTVFPSGFLQHWKRLSALQVKKQHIDLFNYNTGRCIHRSEEVQELLDWSRQSYRSRQSGDETHTEPGRVETRLDAYFNLRQGGVQSSTPEGGGSSDGWQSTDLTRMD